MIHVYALYSVSTSEVVDLNYWFCTEVANPVLWVYLYAICFLLHVFYFSLESGENCPGEIPKDTTQV